MPRELFPSSNDSGATAATPSDAPKAPAVPPVSAAQPQDVLSGALPAWDLLPGTPFVRRVK